MSTLLHCLGRLDSPSAGEVWIGDENMSTLSDTARGRLRNRALGFVYQFHHLLPEFTALENVAMPLLIRRMPAAQAEAQASELLSRVGLGERSEEHTSELKSLMRISYAVF